MVVGCKWRGPWPSSFLFYHMLVALVLATEFLGLVEGAINFEGCQFSQIMSLANQLMILFV